MGWHLRWRGEISHQWFPNQLWLEQEWQRSCRPANSRGFKNGLPGLQSQAVHPKSSTACKIIRGIHPQFFTQNCQPGNLLLQAKSSRAYWLTMIVPMVLVHRMLWSLSRTWCPLWMLTECAEKLSLLPVLPVRDHGALLHRLCFLLGEAGLPNSPWEPSQPRGGYKAGTSLYCPHWLHLPCILVRFRAWDHPSHWAQIASHVNGLVMLRRSQIPPFPK